MYTLSQIIEGSETAMGYPYRTRTYTMPTSHWNPQLFNNIFLISSGMKKILIHKINFHYMQLYYLYDFNNSILSQMEKFYLITYKFFNICQDLSLSKGNIKSHKLSNYTTFLAKSNQQKIYIFSWNLFT